MREPGFGGATAVGAIVIDPGGERLPEGRDVEVTTTRWHRLDSDGRLIGELRVGLSPEGKYYLDGHTRCSEP